MSSHSQPAGPLSRQTETGRNKNMSHSEPLPSSSRDPTPAGPPQPQAAADFATLHLKPATKQTVVTTTTTTTVSFEPFKVPLPADAPLMPEHEWHHPYQGISAASAAPPARSKEGRLDPRTYPLARARRPSLLGNLKFPLGGTQASLDEAPESSASAAARQSPSQTDKEPVDLGANSNKRKAPSRKTRGASKLNESLAAVSSTGVSHHQFGCDGLSAGDTTQHTRKKVKLHHHHRHPQSPEPENKQMPSPLLSPGLSAIENKSPECREPQQHQHQQPSPLEEQVARTRHQQHQSAEGDHSVNLNLGEGTEVATLLSLPSLVEQFSSLPNNLQSHVLFNLLRRTTLPVLQVVNSLVAPALRRDFLSDLPLELGALICYQLDGQSLCRASRVSKKWRTIIDGTGRVWKRRLIDEDLWIGDGTEQRDEKALAAGQKPRSERKEFLDRWLDGQWDIHYNEKLAAKSADRKLRALHSSPGRPIESLGDPFTVQRSSPAPSRSGSEARESFEDPLPFAPTPLKTRQKKKNPERRVRRTGHYVHPLKIVYKHRFLERRSWFQGEPVHYGLVGQGNAVVTCLQFDRERIASASDDPAINIYDLKNNGQHSQLVGHAGGIWALEYLGDTLVSGSTDRTVRVWDLKTGRCTHVLLGHISTVRCLQIVEPQNVNPDPQGEPVWEPPYPLIITGSRDTTLRVWKLPKPGQRDFLPHIPSSPDMDNINPDVNPYHVRMLPGHHQAVRALSAHGRIAVSGSYDKTARVWDILSGTCLQVLRGHTQRVYSVVYDPVKQRAATGAMDGSLRLWSTETGDCLHQLVGHDALVGLIGLNPRTLVSAAADSTLRVWNSDSGQCQSTLSAHSGAITCFQHDDTKVVSGGDGSLKLWDVKTGKFIRDLLVSLQGIWQVGFQDGFCVASVLRNGQSEFDIFDFGTFDEHEDLSQCVIEEVGDSSDEDEISEAKNADEDSQSDPNDIYGVPDSPSFNMGNRTGFLTSPPESETAAAESEELQTLEEEQDYIVQQKLRALRSAGRRRH